MTDINRLRWRCRRGLLELDLVLGRFLDRYYGELSPGDLAVFCELLRLPDTELWAEVSRTGLPTDDPRERVLSLLRQC